MADLHDSTEHYLSAIYGIEEEGVEVKRARIAERLGISAPSVTEHIGRMVNLGLLDLSEDNSVSFTVLGRQQATNVVRRHRLAERLLVDVIGLKWQDAHREADRWEHVISDDVEKKLDKLLGHPDSCPHGNPIPQKDGSPNKNLKDKLKKSKPLYDFEIGDEVVLFRIGESIEMNFDSLEFVGNHKLIPGTTLILNSKEKFQINVTMNKKQIDIPTTIAKSLFVLSGNDK